MEFACFLFFSERACILLKKTFKTLHFYHFFFLFVLTGYAEKLRLKMLRTDCKCYNKKFGTAASVF